MTKWTVDRLIERLTEVSEEGKGEWEVRIAMQPNYPLQSHLKGVAHCEEELPDVVFLAESSQVYDTPYAPRWVWDYAE